MKKGILVISLCLASSLNSAKETNNEIKDVSISWQDKLLKFEADCGAYRVRAVGEDKKELILSGEWIPIFASRVFAGFRPGNKELLSNKQAIEDAFESACMNPNQKEISISVN